MPRFEQQQRTKHRQVVEVALGTFPEEYTAKTGGGDDSAIDELLELIDRVVSEATARALGGSAGIEVA